MFPVLWQGDRHRLAKLSALDCPREVPWDFIAAHAAECMRNHDQSPETLASRGGLGPEEMVAVIKGSTSWEQRRGYWGLSPEAAVAQLKTLLAAFEARK